MIAVIDYRAGNLTSVAKALKHLGADVTVTENPADIVSADRLILPGVGHFAATRRLDQTAITAAVHDAIRHGTPYLGICVGMQWLFEGSAEALDQPGLGYFHGKCERFPEGGVKVPHVGWNSLKLRPESRLLAGIAEGDFAYFTHSYRAPLSSVTVAVTDYGEPFASAVEQKNVMGVQFHPEKSGETGLRVLRNFLEWRPC